MEEVKKILFVSVLYDDEKSEEIVFANELEAIYFLKNKLIERLE